MKELNISLDLDAAEELLHAAEIMADVNFEDEGDSHLDEEEKRLVLVRASKLIQEKVTIQLKLKNAKCSPEIDASVDDVLHCLDRHKNKALSAFDLRKELNKNPLKALQSLYKINRMKAAIVNDRIYYTTGRMTI